MWNMISIAIILCAIQAQGQTKVVCDTNVMYQDWNGVHYHKGTIVKSLYDAQKHVEVLAKEVRSLKSRIRKLEESAKHLDAGRIKELTPSKWDSIRAQAKRDMRR
jgi:hypothetical protein